MNHETMLRILEHHRIARVSLKAFRGRYSRLHGKNAVKGCHGFGGSVPIAQLETDQGAKGWGALCASPAQARAVMDLLQGQRLSQIFSPASGLTDARFAAFDIALHDLAGVILDMPVYRMLNPNAQPLARVYDGAIYMNDIIPEDRPQGVGQILRDCADDWQAGHRMFKIKVGRGHKWMAHDAGLDRDVEVVRQVHAQHPSAVLMVDANDGYSLADALTFLQRLEGVPLYWIEEPFPEGAEADGALQAYLRVHRPGALIADGENKPNIPQLMDLAAKGLIHVLQPDVCGYGFTRWRAWMPALAQQGFLGSPHAWGDQVKTYYCAHLAAAWPHHIPCVEAVLGASEGVDDGGYRLHEGMLTLPQRPGFGLELRWAPELADA